MEKKKICTECGIEKELDDFHKKKSGKFGHAARCKVCDNRRRKQNYQENRDVALENQKQYNQKNREKIAERMKKYRQQNKNRIKNQRKKHYLENREDIIEYQKQYYKENREKLAERKRLYNKRHYNENKQFYFLKVQKREAHKKFLPDSLTEQEWNETFNHFDNACALSKGTSSIHKDHFIPLSWGVAGTTKQNMCPITGSLNISKGNKNPFEWIRDYPELSENFDKLVSYLASLNNMTVLDFRNYVYECEANKRSC